MTQLDRHALFGTAAAIGWVLLLVTIAKAVS